MLHRPSIALLSLACVLVLPFEAVAGSCARLLAVLEKADAQARLAQIEVAGPDQAPRAQPMLVRIDKTVYTNLGGSWDSRPTTANPLITQIRDAQAQGKGSCESAGSGSVRGAAAEKVRYLDPQRQKLTGATTVWIDLKSGLPAYHEFGDLGPGGFAWIYGDAVRAPGVVKPLPDNAGQAAKDLLGGARAIVGR